MLRIRVMKMLVLRVEWACSQIVLEVRGWAASSRNPLTWKKTFDFGSICFVPAFREATFSLWNASRLSALFLLKGSSLVNRSRFSVISGQNPDKVTYLTNGQRTSDDLLNCFISESLSRRWSNINHSYFPPSLYKGTNI